MVPRVVDLILVVGISYVIIQTGVVVAEFYVTSGRPCYALGGTMGDGATARVLR